MLRIVLLDAWFLLVVFPTSADAFRLLFRHERFVLVIVLRLALTALLLAPVLFFRVADEIDPTNRRRTGCLTRTVLFIELFQTVWICLSAAVMLAR